MEKPAGARGQGEELRTRTPSRAIAAALLLVFSTGTAWAKKLDVPPGTREALRFMYNGNSERAIELARKIQQEHPDHPIGYLVEANATWWQFYCEACSIKWNMIDAWKRSKLPKDDAYFALVDRAIERADAALAKQETPEMRLYAGLAWALRARLSGLRDERLATARAGVKARKHFLRALELDPDLADASTGLGLYNYYADALSAFTKILRFFMGIPGGSKKDGLQQLDTAMKDGDLTRGEARFYAAKCARNYDHDYERAIELMEPLVEQFPRNPVFHLLLGDMYAKLARNEKAAASFETARRLAREDSPCGTHLQQIAQQALDLLRASSQTAGSP